MSDAHMAFTMFGIPAEACNVLMQAKLPRKMFHILAYLTATFGIPTRSLVCIEYFAGDSLVEWGEVGWDGVGWGGV